MLGLSKKKQDILSTMGVTIWSCRNDPVPDSTPEPDPSPELDQVLILEIAGIFYSEVGVPSNADESAAEILTQDNAAVAEFDDRYERSPDPLKRAWQSVEACRRHSRQRTQINKVTDEAERSIRWMFIDEKAGAKDEGQATARNSEDGPLLDAMIAALGVNRQEVYIARAMNYPLSENPDDGRVEIKSCDQFMQQQIELIAPDIIVVLGHDAARSLLQTDKPLETMRQSTYRYGALNTPMVVTFSPAYLLQNPPQKAEAWQDLWQAKQIAGV
ncbi:MAG: uracil-DNA glycosylase [Pseudomonadota bacterium]